MTQTSARSLAVWWKDLDRWSVGSQRRSSWQWPPSVVKPLGLALERRHEPVDKKVFELRPEHFLRLKFSGEILPRDLHGKVEFKGGLFFAYPGDIIYSKIDVRNGAIGIIPPLVPIATVTSEFPVYRIKKDVALSEYIQIVFRTKHFLRIINGMVSGASGRKRVEPNNLETVEIPIPSLAEQKFIVDRWRKAQNEISAARDRVEKRETAIWVRFCADLGLRLPNMVAAPKAFAAWWKDVDRWGVQMIALNARSESKSLFPQVRLAELCRIGSGGTPSRMRSDYFGGDIPWVKTTEVRNELITSTEETLTEEGLQNSSARLFSKGSLIVAMYGQGATRGRTAKLGIDAATNQACAVLFNIDEEVETDFLWYFLMSQYEAMRSLASGNNQPNLNAEMIANVRIPVPPKSTQKDILRRVAAGRQEIARERESADHLTEQINAEIESLVVGVKVADEL